MKLLPSPLVCRDAVELVSDYLDGTLSRRQRRRLEKHLAGVRRLHGLPRSDACDDRREWQSGPEDLPSDVVEGLVNLFRQYRDDK